MPAGAPSKITPELLTKAELYVAGEWVNHKLQSGRNRVMPTIEGLAIYLGLSRETIYARSEFSDIAMRLKSYQHEEVLNGTADGSINPVAGKLILSSKHGYVEKQEVDNKSSDGSMSPKGAVDKSQVDELIDIVKNKTAKDAQ